MDSDQPISCRVSDEEIVEDQPMVKKKNYAWSAMFKKKVYNDNNAKAGTKKCKISTTDKKTYNLKKLLLKIFKVSTF